MKDSADLLPCPNVLCKSTDLDVFWKDPIGGHIACRQCDASLKNDGIKKWEDAKKAWNSRPMVVVEGITTAEIQELAHNAAKVFYGGTTSDLINLCLPGAEKLLEMGYRKYKSEKSS